MTAPTDDDRDDFDDHGCWNCDGEGYVYSCFSVYACADPEYGCDECMRRCDICNPFKPSSAIAQAKEL